MIEWASVSVPHPGEQTSGDLHVIVDRPGGALVSVMDGLGHGPRASEAVEIAADVLRRSSPAPLPDLINDCHKALGGSRGIAMTVAEVDANESTVTWAGVGNVEGKLLRAGSGPDRQNESVLLRGGVVGYQIPAIKPYTLRLFPGDALVFATDGVSPSFGDGVMLAEAAQRIAEQIMTRHYRQADDGLVVVGRYLGLEYG